MTIDDGSVVLAYGNLVGSTQHLDGSLLQLQASLLADYETAGQCSDVLKHSLSAVAEAGSLNGTDLQLAAQTVHNKGGQSLSLNVLGNNQEGTASLYSRFQNGQEVLQVADLLVIDEDVGVLHLALHLLGVGYEVGREVATVELHALYHTDGGVSALCLLNGDNAIFAHLLHSICQELANLGVVVGADGSNLLNLLIVVAHNLSHVLDFCNNGSNGLVDTALQVHGVGTSCHVLQTFANDSLSQYGSSGCTITSIIASLGSHALHQLCTSILEGVCQLNLLCHSNTVLGDVGSTELLLDDNVAALGTESYLYCICQTVHALLHQVASLYVEFNVFCHSFIICLILKGLLL